MKQLTLFYIPTCPYCKNGFKALEELKKDPRYADISIKEVNERVEVKLAESYDYWNVPCFFLGDKKLYEAKPGHDYGQIFEGVKASLEAALEV